MDEKGFNMVTRPMWAAKPCKGYEAPTWPLENVVVYYNTETPKCVNREQCVEVLQRLQKFQQKRGLADLHWNFLIGSDGNVYEGRGWHREPSKCVLNHAYDTKNYSVAYIGNWTYEPVPEEMKTAFTHWVNLGIKRGWISEKYNLVEERKKLPIVESPKLKDEPRLTFQW